MNKTSIKTGIISETPNVKISYEKSNYGFSINELSVYLDIFNKFKNDGFIIANNFDDTHWILYDKNKTKGKTNLLFDLEVQKELNLALKCYILKSVNAGLSYEHIGKELNKIKSTFIETFGFDEKYFSEYEDEFFMYSGRKREAIIQASLSFNDFYGKFLSESYIDLFKDTPLEERKIRVLPNYESVLIFDYVLNNYMDNCNTNERKKYMPILLWWRITTIIPLRPSEFLDLKYNCAFVKDESYWITVPREKQKANKYGIDITNTLKITKQLYDLIEEYRNLQNEEEQGEYLMSYMSYYSFIVANNIRNGAIDKRLRLDKMDKGQLYELLDDFYTLIVEEKYEYKNLERVRAGDTRHFAFCNMMLQGFNMLSIARIGGHLHLRSQLTYTSHLDYFARARVRVLSEQIKRNRERNLGDTYLSDTNSLVVRSKLYSKNEGSKTIQDGFCHDENFPDNCIDDCVFCPHYTLDLSKPNILKDLSFKSNIINQNIKDQISSMQRISNDMMYDTQTLQYSHEEQEKLFNLANKLNKLFNKKALLDSYLEDYEEDK